MHTWQLIGKAAATLAIPIFLGGFLVWFIAICQCNIMGGGHRYSEDIHGYDDEYNERAAADWEHRRLEEIYGEDEAAAHHEDRQLEEVYGYKDQYIDKDHWFYRWKIGWFVLGAVFGFLVGFAILVNTGGEGFFD